MIEIVCEIGINGNGDVALTKDMIKMCKDAGADYVKFQKRTLESCYTEEELNTPRESPWGTTTREQKIGLEYAIAEYMSLITYCYKIGIGWFASPWDIKSIFHITNLGSPFIKVPSPLITNEAFLRICQKSGKNIILSTGMSTDEQITTAIKTIRPKQLYAVLHCTSTYPSKTEELNLSYIPRLQRKLQKLGYPDTKVGFSTHHPGIIFAPAAVAMGAEMVEFHVTMDKTSYGSDQAASFNPDGVRKMIKYIRDVETALGDGVKTVYESEKPIMAKLRRV